MFIPKILYLNIEAHFYWLVVLEILFGGYLLLSSLYILIFALFGSLYKRGNNVVSNSLPDGNSTLKWAVLIPAYREDAVIIDSAKKALNQDYNSDLFHVIVIADSLKSETVMQLKQLPITVAEVSFEKSTKAKSINYVLASIDQNLFDIVAILDADNIMAPDFISKMSARFSAGFKAVQGHRVAKNLNTSTAILDAISEEVNNTIFRSGHRALGLSAALIGSGMAFDFSTFKSIMSQIDAIGGFDKELEIELIKQNITIDYVPDALVYDEKVQSSVVFKNQRRRWISVQILYFKRYAFTAIKGLLKFWNIDLFDKVFQMAIPPRSLLLASNFILSIIFSLLDITGLYSLFGWGVWVAIMLSSLVAIFISIPRELRSYINWHTVMALPKAIVNMFIALCRTKGANKRFIHTSHGIDNK